MERSPVARNWPGSRTKMIRLLCLAVYLLAGGAWGQRVDVEPEVSSYPGQNVTMTCKFKDPAAVQLTMVTWIYEPKDGERINIAVYHPMFSPNYPDSPVKGRVSFQPSSVQMDNPSIQIQNVRMSDEGRYICEFATYPSGNEQGITNLAMLAKPQNAASTVTVEAGLKKVVVARCESLNGRPEAKISWVTTAKGEATSISTPGPDNTVTVTSEYKLIPTASDNGKDISCVVEHRTQDKPESFPLKLAVQYPPQVSISGYDNNWYVGRTNVVLTCQASGNPMPTMVLWRAMSGEMPDTVQVVDNQLKVLKVDDAVNTTFVCEVKNRIGVGKDQVAVFVRGTRLPQKGATTGSIIGIIIGVIIVLAIIGTAIAMYRKHRSKINGDGPPKHKPPPPNKNKSSAGNREMTIIRQDNPPPETRPLQNEFTNIQNAEPVTDLDGYYDDENVDEGPEHYYSAAPSGWDDPGNTEVPPPYMRTPGDYTPPPGNSPTPPPGNHGNHGSYTPTPPGNNVSRGDSFISPAMFV